MDLGKLYAIRSKGHNERQNGEKTLGSLTTSILNELTAYENYIGDFFSDNNQTKQIKVIYESIQKPIFEDYMIECGDLYAGLDIYREYHEGMFQFVDEILHSKFMCESEEIKDYSEKLERAKNSDGDFVLALFDGEYNPNKNMAINESVSNIACMVDTTGFIQNLKDKFKSIPDFNNNDESNVTLESVDLMYESVSSFLYENIASGIRYMDSISNEIANPKKQTSKKEEQFELF